MEHLKVMTGWREDAANANLHGYNSSQFFRWHLILSLIFQHVRICAIMTPKEAHDRILIRLQEEYYPLRQTPTLCYLGIQALVIVRYFWLAAKMLFLELYLLDLAFWKIHRYARRKNILPQCTRIFSPGFHRLAVLAPLPPSRFRYLLARIVSSIWYWWASFLSVPLIAWIVFNAAKS
ncbi:hypothetical protein H0G86_003786 [Trichoderma simmonsii]|uniref:Uncharacterized protein n=1 Tax=Trichoderma simmonsii TaxID=1491479 RepID=A0A8G0L6A9_9HYPO|nr:hypothetical protein H0G86_003786 [Trichoderma simmonsii]